MVGLATAVETFRTQQRALENGHGQLQIAIRWHSEASHGRCHVEGLHCLTEKAIYGELNIGLIRKERSIEYQEIQFGVTEKWFNQKKFVLN